MIRHAVDDLGTHLVQCPRLTSQLRILLDDDDLGGVIDVGEIHPVVARLSNDGQGSEDEQADDDNRAQHPALDCDIGRGGPHQTRARKRDQPGDPHLASGSPRHLGAPTDP